MFESTDLGIYYDVTNIEIVGSYTLLLAFDDGQKQVINFEPLRDLNLFNQVQLNEIQELLNCLQAQTLTPSSYMIGRPMKTKSPQAIASIKLFWCRGFSLNTDTGK